MQILCTVDIRTRELYLEDVTIAAFDHLVDDVLFVIEPIDGFQLETSTIKIAAVGPLGEPHDYEIDSSTVTVDEETGNINFVWSIPVGVTAMPLTAFKISDTKNITFAVCAEIVSGDNLVKAWHSDDGTIKVKAHLEPESGGGEDPSEEATNAQKIGQLQTDMAVVQRAVAAVAGGTPTVVDSISDMTDTGLIYILSSDSKWYYYNGSAWQIGGTYGGAVTDTTLSISGAPADAKAVGDALAEKADSSDVTAIETEVAGKADSADVEALDTRVTAVEGTVDAIDSMLSTIEPITPTYMEHRYIKTDGSTGVSSAYNLYKIGLTGIGKIRITSQNASRQTASIAFYSVSVDDLAVATAIADNCLLVGTIHETTDQTEYTEEYNVPTGALSALVLSANAYGVPTVEKYSLVDVAGEIENISADVADKVDGADTIYTSDDTPTYIVHRYLTETGLPSDATSGYWSLYKVDVTDCDAVKIKTYRTASGSRGLPAHSFVSSDFADVTGTSETVDTVVEVGDTYTGTADMITETVVIPDGAKTMFVHCDVEKTEYPVITKYHYGNFSHLKSVSEIPERLDALESATQGLTIYANSPYYRNVRWGNGVLTEYYHSEDDGISLFPSTITAAQYFSMFNALVADYAGYAESHQMGLASDGETMMYYYTFNPPTGEDNATNKRPKIIISAGQHGFEKTANYGVYHFIKDILENWESNSFLDYVRNHVILIVMPMLNPWGHDNDKYVNANGVNLNRNWDTQAWSQGGSPGDTTYGGASPLDQPETQYASAVILDNLDALWLMDFHNNGQVAPRAANSYLWHSFGLVTYSDPYFAKAVNAAKFHVDETTGHLYKDYPDRCDYVVSGHFTDNNAPSHQGLITAYAREHNIMAATIEGAAAFIEYGNRYTSGIHHLDADLLGNWIRILISNFARLEG